MIDNNTTFKDKEQNTKKNSVLFALVEWLKIVGIKAFMVIIVQYKFGTSWQTMKTSINPVVRKSIHKIVVDERVLNLLKIILRMV